MGILDVLGKGVGKDPDFINAQKARKIQKILNEREKSSNQRVLEKFQEEERQKKIKGAIDKINQQRTREHFSGGMLKAKNIFAGNKNIFKGQSNMLKSTNVLKDGSLFFK